MNMSDIFFYRKSTLVRSLSRIIESEDTGMIWQHIWRSWDLFAKMEKNGEVDKLEGYIKEIEKNYCMEDLN